MNVQSDTRTRILATARELFHSRSYADVGVKQICDTAHVQKGGFYYFFPSKRDLASAVLGYLEGIILLAKTQNDPEVIRILGPAIKSLRIEQLN